ncbi:hypothetical protein [Carnobacterium mobile]|nr:hypothetical protein [Carnobacterium mobile]
MSTIIQLVKEACAAAETIGSSYLLLDRYFLSGDILRLLHI